MAEIFKRYFQIDSADAVNEQARTVNLSFSSDVALERAKGVYEVLSHEPGAANLERLNNSAQLLWNHDVNTILGVVESADLPGNKGYATVRFSSSPLGEEKFNQVKEGVLRNVSFGYTIDDAVEDITDNKRTIFVRSWTPTEISIVTIPADHSVGVGRSINPKNLQKIMKKTVEEQVIPTEKRAGDAPKMDLVAERNEAVELERERIAQINELAQKRELSELGNKYIREGKSADAFRIAVLEHIDANAQAGQEPLATRNDPVGLSKSEIQDFSFVRLLNAISSPLGKSAQEAAAFELEASAAAAERMGRSTNGVVIPVDVLQAPMKRDIVSVGLSSGGYSNAAAGGLVDDTLLTGSFIEFLKNKTVIMRLGTKMAGLIGNFTIPKELTDAAGYWLNAEDESAQDIEHSIGAITLSPKTVAGKTELTRAALKQPAMDMEAFVRRRLARALSVTIDTAGFYGTGTGGQPLGLKNTTGINVVDFAATNPTYNELVQMESEIAADNADIGSMAYIANARARGYFKTTTRFPSATDNGDTIWEPGGTVNGYKTIITNQVADNDYFFGNFAQLIIGMWGGLELQADPYTHSDRRRLRITVFQDVDLNVEHPEAICYGNNVTP